RCPPNRYGHIAPLSRFCYGNEYESHHFVGLEHLRDESGDRAPLRPGEGDVAEQRMALAPLGDRRHPVVTSDPEVVALRNMVGQHAPGVLSDSAENSEQHVALE